ncbi:MAG: nucleotidyltransferase family protein [Nitrospirales bacterium]|nr:nucleotidyltransferase family protein [Nitrospirales bacterium]
MKPSEALSSHREDIRRVLEENRTRNPRVFGSVLHGSDRDDSDLDILVDPTPETTLMDIARIQNRLLKILGVSVDLLTPEIFPQSFRDSVLKEALPV